MVKGIVSENSSFVIPSHQGLTPLEIIKDCMEKIQFLSMLGIGNAQQMEQAQCLQLLSMLDDWNAIAQHQLKAVTATYIEHE